MPTKTSGNLCPEILFWYCTGKSSVLNTGLSIRFKGQGFPPASMGVVPSYFYWKLEEK